MDPRLYLLSAAAERARVSLRAILSNILLNILSNINSLNQKCKTAIKKRSSLSLFELNRSHSSSRFIRNGALKRAPSSCLHRTPSPALCLLLALPPSQPKTKSVRTRRRSRARHSNGSRTVVESISHPGSVYFYFFSSKLIIELATFGLLFFVTFWFQTRSFCPRTSAHNMTA